MSRPDTWRVIGFTDIAPCTDTIARFGIPRLGADEAVSTIAAASSVCRFVLGIGGAPGATIRRSVVGRLGGCIWATVIHDRAWVSPTAQLGPGTVILAGAIVNSGARVGPHAIINTAAVVEHDVTVGAFTHVCPGAVVGGGATLGDDCTIALGAQIRDHVTVGDGAIVGMGGVVVKSVPRRAIVCGVPAVPLRSTDRG